MNIGHNSGRMTIAARTLREMQRLSRSERSSQHRRDRHHGIAPYRFVGHGLVRILAGLSVGFAAHSRSRCWFSRAPVYNSARLRSWRFLFLQMGERLGGRVIGVLTLTPYDLWRRTHAIHHATSAISTVAALVTWIR